MNNNIKAYVVKVVPFTPSPNRKAIWLQCPPNIRPEVGGNLVIAENKLKIYAANGFDFTMPDNVWPCLVEDKDNVLKTGMSVMLDGYTTDNPLKNQ